MLTIKLIEMIGIYAIYRKSDDRCMYVGQSNRVEGRIYDHLRGHSKNTDFNDVDYYGKILQTFKNDDKEERLNIEAEWITELNPECNKIKNRHHSSESIQKMVDNWGGGMTGKHHSSEAIQKMSDVKKGKPSPRKGKKVGPLSGETKKKISDSLKCRPSPNKGKHWKLINGKRVYF